MANLMLWTFYHNGGGACGCRISVLHGCEMAVSLKLSQVRVKSNFSSFTCVLICLGVCACVYVYVYGFVCVYVCLRVSLCIGVYMCPCVCIYVWCVCVCVVYVY